MKTKLSFFCLPEGVFKFRQTQKSLEEVGKYPYLQWVD